MKIGKIFLVLFIVLLIGACAQQETVEQSSAVEASMVASVEISNFRFVPDTVTIKEGGTVTWTQKDSTPHTVAISDITESPRLNKGGSWSYTFYKTGNYNYICGLHPSMRGRVIVK